MSQQQLAPVPSPLLPSPRLPPELLGRIAYFVSLPSEDLFDHEQDWISAHETLCTLSLVNRTFAAFARPLAWRKFVWSSDDSDESPIAHLYHKKPLQPLVHELAWGLTYTYSRMSLIALPLLSALTSFAFEPSEGGDYEVPKGITDILPRMAHLRRFEVRYCAGWEDEAFSVGRTVPSLRTLIIDREWCNHRLTDQELGNLQHLESPIDFWGELVLSSKSARALSLSTLRELRLSDAENLDTGMVEYKYYAQLIEQHLNSTPAPAPVSLEVLTFTLPNTFDDPLSWLPLLRAFRSPPSLHEVAFEQTSLVEAPNLAPWELLRLPQARKLSLKVPGYRNPDKMNAALPFSVILSSFPQLKSLTLDNVFALDRVESTICVPAPPQDTPLQQLLYFVEGETEIETVDLREDDEKRFVRCRRDPGPVGGFIRELWHSEL